jgi:hypothetical protein
MPAMDATGPGSGNAFALWGIQAAYRPVGGGWGPSMCVSEDTSMFPQASSDIAVDVAGNGYAIWQDNRNTNRTTWYIHFSRALRAEPEHAALGDVNEDGLVNSTDALIILTYDAGLSVGTLPVGQPGCPSNITQPPGCNP